MTEGSDGDGGSADGKIDVSALPPHTDTLDALKAAHIAARSHSHPTSSLPDFDGVEDATVHNSATAPVVVDTWECTVCGVRRPAKRHERAAGGTKRMACYGSCEGRVDHRSTATEWEPVRLSYECPTCGYTTMYWEEPEQLDDVECPECDLPEPETRDGIPVVTTENDDEGLEAIPGAFDVSEAIEELRSVNGIDSTDVALNLVQAGFTTRDDLKYATEEELRETGGLLTHIVTRIKADVGDPEPRTLELVDVVLKEDGDDGGD